MRNLLVKGISGLSLMMLCATSVKAQSTQNIKISVDQIEQNLEYLSSDELAGRKTGEPGIEKAASFLEEKMRTFGLKPYFETYRDSFQVNGLQGYNVVGLLEGTNEDLKDEYIIIGAHYDHIGTGKEVNGDVIANGANDNAAGTVAVIELAKQLSELGNNGRSLLFVLFSAEEMGLKGSQHLAEKLKAEGMDLYAMINMEMIGVPMKAKDYEAYLTGYEKSNLAEKFNEYSNGEKVLGFLPQASQLSLFKRSDNYPFYTEFGVPAQTISTFDFSNYDYYHHVDDESENLDPEHMAALFNKLIPGLHKMTMTSEKEIKMNQE
ncbi:M20/M25/M40 family metallo-hydrolase [Gramella sp. GC03-9]|uniref:M20/M25/M40 family metallo-hydrolase n=1 Tax=Christiangramia oceanisediminis TaxID=2920386 RepID=A0A9X2L070_9FLAO|nr:M20/M25/M40 family metallo-hydrolase [Gramella oceanisediminis]MCP9201588.1 M20/M25/M40 family metallo-hydrolase [Gramella oceanisediminis]